MLKRLLASFGHSRSEELRRLCCICRFSAGALQMLQMFYLDLVAKVLHIYSPLPLIRLYLRFFVSHLHVRYFARSIECSYCVHVLLFLETFGFTTCLFIGIFTKSFRSNQQQTSALHTCLQKAEHVQNHSIHRSAVEQKLFCMKWTDKKLSLQQHSSN